jgi:hypothetical protein
MGERPSATNNIFIQHRVQHFSQKCNIYDLTLGNMVEHPPKYDLFVELFSNIFIQIWIAVSQEEHLLLPRNYEEKIILDTKYAKDTKDI